MDASRILGALSSIVGVEGVLGTDMRYVDLTEELDSDEVVTDILVASEDSVNHSISDGAVNTVIVVYDTYYAIAIGKGVEWRETVLVANSKAKPIVYVSYITNNGKADTVYVTQPITPAT